MNLLQTDLVHSLQHKAHYASASKALLHLAPKENSPSQIQALLLYTGKSERRRLLRKTNVKRHI